MRLTLLGSTGSIGTQTLDVARERGYTVAALAAGRNLDLLDAQGSVVARMQFMHRARFGDFASQEFVVFPMQAVREHPIQAIAGHRDQYGDEEGIPERQAQCDRVDFHGMTQVRGSRM